MESRVRLLLVKGGLPRPVSQVSVYDAQGRFVGRLDLALPGTKVAVEYDGAQHWQQRRADDRRRDALRALGWTVLVFSAADYYQESERLVHEVRAAVARQAA
jgi:very-short-patch-repair endonuclease